MTYRALTEYERDGVTVGLITEVAPPNDREYNFVVAVAQPIRLCESCGQDFPFYHAGNVLTIGQFGRVENFDRQHQCGVWAPIVEEHELWAPSSEDVPLDMVAAELVKRVADKAEIERDDARRKVIDRLRANLNNWVDHVPDCDMHGYGDEYGYCPCEDDMGSSTKPGIVLGPGRIWEAWAQDPTDPEEWLSVPEEKLQ